MLAGVAGLLVVVDLTCKAIATNALSDGQVVNLGLLQLRLAYNRGVAFGLGASVSPVVVLTVTGLATTALAVYAWQSAAAVRPIELAGLAMLLGGAVANLIDRVGDGVVTDYLHSGWWPTFNLADTFITLGAGLLIVAALLPPKDHGQSPGSDNSGGPGLAHTVRLPPPGSLASSALPSHSLCQCDEQGAVDRETSEE